MLCNSSLEQQIIDCGGIRKHCDDEIRLIDCLRCIRQQHEAWLRLDGSVRSSPSAYLPASARQRNGESTAHESKPEQRDALGAADAAAVIIRGVFLESFSHPMPAQASGCSKCSALSSSQKQS